MAKAAASTARKPKRRSSCFLGCFGFSGKASEKKLLPDVPKSDQSPRNINRCLSRRWSFHFKKSASKTVPVVDANVPGKPSKQRREIINYSKSSDHKLSSVIRLPAAGNKVAEIEVVEEDRPLDINPQKVDEKNQNFRNIIIENHDKPRKNEEGKNVLFSCRKNGVKAKSIDDLNCPVRRKTSITRCKSQPAVFHSTTSASASGPPKPKKTKASTAIANCKMSNSSKLDSTIGMSVILVTLLTMVLWGKVCAILCTSAWFFFVPRLRSAMESNDHGPKKGTNHSDDHILDSEEYKRRVVLEGFLTRDNRKVAGFL